jgi:hypothetical protein
LLYKNLSIKNITLLIRLFFIAPSSIKEVGHKSLTSNTKGIRLSKHTNPVVKAQNKGGEEIKTTSGFFINSIAIAEEIEKLI